MRRPSQGFSPKSAGDRPTRTHNEPNLIAVRSRGSLAQFILTLTRSFAIVCYVAGRCRSAARPPRSISNYYWSFPTGGNLIETNPYLAPRLLTAKQRRKLFPALPTTICIYFLTSTLAVFVFIVLFPILRTNVPVAGPGSWIVNSVFDLAQSNRLYVRYGVFPLAVGYLSMFGIACHWYVIQSNSAWTTRAKSVVQGFLSLNLMAAVTIVLVGVFAAVGSVVFT